MSDSKVTDFAQVDPFDPENFKSENTLQTDAVQEILTVCRVGNPPKDAFVRANPDPEMSLRVHLYISESTGETYLLTPAVAAELATMGLAKPAVLTAAIDRQGVSFLWKTTPVPEDGRDNSWHLSGRKALEAAKQGWVRMQSDQSAKGYRLFKAKIEIPDPIWPDYSMRDFLQVSFGANTITDPRDQMVLRLLGLA